MKLGGVQGSKHGKIKNPNRRLEEINADHRKG